jgi:virginiamycin B lyase
LDAISHKDAPLARAEVHARVGKSRATSVENQLCSRSSAGGCWEPSWCSEASYHSCGCKSRRQKESREAVVVIPETGEVNLAAVPTPNANPYGIAVNSQGVPFFAEFGSNRLASIDPDTMQIREYVLPHAESHPRRIAITSDDVVWYTDYPRGALGRFDPKTGEAREWPSPAGPESGPYGITVLKDVVWYSESGTTPNRLVRFDPKTESFHAWAIPSGGGVVRNMMATREGNLVLACSGVNRIALVTMK